MNEKWGGRDWWLLRHTVGTLWDIMHQLRYHKKVLDPDDSPAPAEKPPLLPPLRLQKVSFLYSKDISKLNHHVFNHCVFSIHKSAFH